MNNARIRALESGLNGAARKVLEAIPIAEAWNAAQIAAEIARVATPMERRIVDGCLKHIVESGLARAVKPGVFQRIAAKEEAAAVEVTEPTWPVAVTFSPAPQHPLAQFDAIAAEIREHGRKQQAFYESIADQIEAAALQMDASAAADREASAKARKLAQLFKELDA
jgi:hypothetical protein